MKCSLGSFLCLAALVFGSTSISHAATNATVGQLSCVSSNGPTITARISYFDVTQASVINTGSQSSGAGAGKTSFNPFVIHTSLANFTAFAGAQVFQSCTLTPTTAGANIQYEFALVAITSVDGIADGRHTDGEEPQAYTKVSFEYAGLKVQSSNNGGSSKDHNN